MPAIATWICWPCKGHVTADWARHLRWWKANGRVRQVVLTAARGGGWERDVVQP